MEVGSKRTTIARIAAAVGFVCGLLGLMAGSTEHVWKFVATGWFRGGALLMLIAVFVLVDGAVAFQKTRR